jgi:MoaA/NifB/PqqE/SkfB family radical SAM enzyme
MIDIRKITNGYWWNAKGKFNSIVKGRINLKELTMQITDKCNKKCPKCNQVNFTFRDMEYEVVKSIIKQACALGLKHIHFTGGEPTLYPHFIKVVELCKEYKLRVDMSTNGSFTLEYLYKLIGAGMDSINISWDFLDQKPECIEFLDKIFIPCFINHMVMPSNYKNLIDFLYEIREKYLSIIDIQLMPPRGTAEKFTIQQIHEFNESIASYCYTEFRKRFPMVAYKVKDMLRDKSTRGIYHAPILWPCHRAKSELRVGTKGFTTCTYLYRDGYVTCGLNNSVKDAWEQCKKECKSIPPVPFMCEYSCSPEITNFNYFIEEELRTR